MLQQNSFTTDSKESSQGTSDLVTITEPNAETVHELPAQPVFPKRKDDPATGWKLSDTWMKLRNLALKTRFFLYILRKGDKLDRPYYVHYQITRRCNFRCVSCRTWQDESYAKGLSLDDMRVMARNLRTVGVKAIALTGGEALLRKDIEDIVRIFRAEGLIIRLQTNGFLITDGLLERLFRAGVSDVFISFDSDDLETFNAINGMDKPEPFHRVRSAIMTAAVMSKRFGANVFLTSVLRKDNVDEVVPLHEFAKKQGVLIGFFGMEIPSADDPMNVRVNDPSLRADDAEAKQLEQAFTGLLALKKTRNNALSVSDRLFKDFVDFYQDPKRDMHWSCRAGRMFMAVLPEGTICVCNGTPPIPGYTFENLPELYARADREDVFNPFRKSCDGCICMRQLEYIAEDRLDLVEKGFKFAKSMLGLSR